MARSNKKFRSYQTSLAKRLIEGYRLIHFDCNTEGNSSLYLAVEEEFVEIVKLMQEKTSEEKIPVSGKSSLHGAILGRGNKGPLNHTLCSINWLSGRGSFLIRKTHTSPILIKWIIVASFQSI
ncbi:unnamed protein product [Prunus armeniaca]